MADIFFNDSDVTHDDASEERESYAGRFAIFGHTICWGDDEHCDIPPGPPRCIDDRPSHPLTRAFKRVVVTEALKKAIKEGDDLSITILVSSEDDNSEQDHSEHHHHEAETSQHLDFKGMQLVIFE